MDRAYVHTCIIKAIHNQVGKETGRYEYLVLVSLAAQPLIVASQSLRLLIDMCA
jgi:hypothetical protein